MAKRYRVKLTAEERDELDRMISRGGADARKLAHARVLLQADASEGGARLAGCGDCRGAAGQRADHRAGASAFCRGRLVGSAFAQAELAGLCAQAGRVAGRAADRARLL